MRRTIGFAAAFLLASATIALADGGVSSGIASNAGDGGTVFAPQMITDCADDGAPSGNCAGDGGAGTLASATVSIAKPPLSLTADVAETGCPSAPDLLRAAETALKDGSAVLIPDNGKPADGLLLRYQGTCWRLHLS